MNIVSDSVDLPPLHQLAKHWAIYYFMSLCAAASPQLGVKTKCSTQYLLVLIIIKLRGVGSGNISPLRDGRSLRFKSSVSDRQRN
jgi:hypothetical protein